MKEVVGQIRKGQLVTTFGVGSMVDLPQLSVIVSGLNAWPTAACKEIVEPRLLNAVRAKLPSVRKIRMCPDKTSDEPEVRQRDLTGVPVSIFPRWLRCPLCDTMGTVDSGVFTIEYPPFQVDKIRFIHKGCRAAGTTSNRYLPGAVAARFLTACAKGHVSDFPWLAFCHRGETCSAPSLVLSDHGVTGEAAEVQVRCINDGCKVFRRMADAFGPKADLSILACPGRHPHIGLSENCKEDVKAILLGASNLYFPVTVSVISLPETVVLTDLDTVVKQQWERFEDFESEQDAAGIIKYGNIPELIGSIAADLWAAIERTKEGGGSDKIAEIRADEYALLANATNDIQSDRMSAQIRTALSGQLGDYFERIALVDKLTEFMALVGFTRIDSAGDLCDYDTIDPDRLAPLMPVPTTWVPGAENIGEGIFLKLREDVLSAWETSDAVRGRMADHGKALKAFKRERPWMKIEVPDARYILMHTLSHMLIRELAITCGYSSTSIRERIYSAKGENGVAMSGLLLYTASPDSEGTLGGLVALGDPVRFETILTSALERSRICSSDPICAYYDMSTGSQLHGAACHSCSFVAETSCERSNSFLDRSFVVDTLATTGCCFFAGS
ncbi:MAG: DUF1998 domain-containing protein [Chthonomonadales bacterium]